MEQSKMPELQEQRRLISKTDVLAQIPISTATMWREIAAGRFPKPVRIGARRIAFFQTEIDAWLAQRVAERDAKAAAA
jgi:prophage regulatory protein